MQFGNKSSATDSWSPCTGLMQVIKMCMSITIERIELGGWARSVCLAMTHQLIYKMTYMDHSSGYLTWPEVKFLKSTFQGQTAYVLILLYKRNMMFPVFSSSYLVQNVFANKLILLKSNIFVWPCPGNVKLWPSRKNQAWLDSKHPELNSSNEPESHAGNMATNKIEWH